MHTNVRTLLLPSNNKRLNIYFIVFVFGNKRGSARRYNGKPILQYTHNTHTYTHMHILVYCPTQYYQRKHYRLHSKYLLKVFVGDFKSLLDSLLYP